MTDAELIARLQRQAALYAERTKVAGVTPSDMLEWQAADRLAALSRREAAMAKVVDAARRLDDCVAEFGADGLDACSERFEVLNHTLAALDGAKS